MQFRHFLTWLIPFALFACEAPIKLIGVKAPNLQFEILPTESIVTSSSLEVKWSVVKKAPSYDVILASDAECKSAVIKESGIKLAQHTFSNLVDGRYFICVFIPLGRQLVPSLNNGQEVLVDLLPPLVSLPSQIENHTQGFSVEITVTDITTTSSSWAFVSGPGTVTFEPRDAATIISATKNGAYVVSVTVTDQGGHAVTKYLEFNWNGDTEQVGPRFESLALNGAASDGFINDLEKNLTTPLWTLTSTSATLVQFTSPINNSVPAICDATQVYDQVSSSRPIDLTSDNSFVICVKLQDAEGHTVYGKSEIVQRDVRTATVYVQYRNNGGAISSCISDSIEYSPTSLFLEGDFENNSLADYAVTGTFTVAGANAHSGSLGVVGTAAHSGTSCLGQTVTIADDQSYQLSYFLKSSTESFYDRGRFSVDGVHLQGYSGTLDWTQKKALVTGNGTRTFQWCFQEMDRVRAEIMPCIWTTSPCCLSLFWRQIQSTLTPKIKRLI